MAAKEDVLVLRYRRMVQHLFPKAKAFLNKDSPSKGAPAKGALELADPVMKYAITYLSHHRPSHTQGEHAMYFDLDQWTSPSTNFQAERIYRRVLKRLYPFVYESDQAFPRPKKLLQLSPILCKQSFEEKEAVPSVDELLDVMDNGYQYIRAEIDSYFVNAVEEGHQMIGEDYETRCEMQHRLDRFQAPIPWRIFQLFVERLVAPLYLLATFHKFTEPQITALVKRYIWLPTPRCVECSYQLPAKTSSPLHRFDRCPICQVDLCNRYRKDYDENFGGKEYITCVRDHIFRFHPNSEEASTLAKSK